MGCSCSGSNVFNACSLGTAVLYTQRMLTPAVLTQIQSAVQASQRILLHLHPTPDGDSMGSALAFWHFFKSLGKEVTVISGDSAVPEYLAHLPGADQIEPHPFDQVDLAQYDLFVILDSAALTQISRNAPVEFPEHLNTIVIDHHATNTGFGKINWIEAEYPATCQMVYELLEAWPAEISADMARCLFVGLFTDTGGFQYPPVSAKTLHAAAKLAECAPDFPQMLFPIANTFSAGHLRFQGLALHNIELHHNDSIALSAVSYEQLVSKDIQPDEADKSGVANQLKSVVGWEVGVALAEIDPGHVKASFRTRDPERFHLGKIAASLGGGGHQAAAGLTLKMPLEQAKYEILQAIIAHDGQSSK